MTVKNRTRNGHFDHNRKIRGGENPMWRPSFSLNWTMVNKKTFKGSTTAHIGSKHHLKLEGDRVSW